MSSPSPNRHLLGAMRAGSLALVALQLVALRAAAYDPADPPPPGGDPGAITAGVGHGHSHWAGAGRRPFLAGTVELGVLYVRPQLALGYGEPHHLWFGLDGYADVSSSGGAEYVGLRGATPYVDVRAGLRYEFPTGQYFLDPRPSYTREDVELDWHGRSRYLSLEAELAGGVPVPGGRLILVAGVYGILATPPDLYVFEEALKVVIEPPLLWRGRVGYLATLPWFESAAGPLRLGGAVEVIHNPPRGEPVARAGPLLSVELSCHLEAFAGLMLVVYSPDHLGLLGADFTQVGLRYRWASGDLAPSFP